MIWFSSLETLNSVFLWGFQAVESFVGFTLLFVSTIYLGSETPIFKESWEQNQTPPRETSKTLKLCRDHRQ